MHEIMFIFNPLCFVCEIFDTLAKVLLKLKLLCEFNHLRTLSTSLKYSMLYK